MNYSAATIHGQEIEAIESIVTKANILLRELEDREKNAQQHNANLQAFIGILEDMKSKLIMMIQSYENDNILSKLLVLNDSIDEVVTRLASNPSAEADHDNCQLEHEHNHAPSSFMDPIDFGNLFDNISLDMEDNGARMGRGNSQFFLLPAPLLSDGASSSSSSVVKKKKELEKDNEKEKEKETKEDRKGKLSVKVTCKICDDEYDSWYLLHELSSCKHIYCIECLRSYFTQKIKDGSVLNVMCPDPTCKKETSPNDVRCILDEVLWERFDHLVLISSLKQDPNICWCPYPGCTNAIYREPTEDPKVVCDSCRHQFCALCKDAWHEDLSCEDFASIKEKMEKSVAKQVPSFNSWTTKHSKLVKPCPRCKAFIEKFDGCNHMTCVSCKHQFCWMCLSEYTGVHFNDNVNFPNCYMKQYYSPRPWYKPHVEKETLVKAGKIIGIGAAVMILGVPVAVIGGPIYGCMKLRQKLRPKRWVITNRGWELHNV